MTEIVMLLGADRGDREAMFAQAVALIAERIGPVLAHSRDHWTEPWGFTDHELFLNRALLVASDHPLPVVMQEALAIETVLGRTRSADVRYAPRTIDIDLLFAGSAVVHVPGLELPHPRVQERAFALSPAADLVPGLVHPVLQRTVLDLLNDVLRAA